MGEFQIARRNMVDGQLRPSKVTDANILDAMSQLPREMFVSKSLQGIAYVDEDIEIADHRYLIEPLVVARLVQALELTKDTSVLVIGAATGYDAALIGRLARSVVAVESDPHLVKQATMVINHLGIDNVAVVEGALQNGFAEQGPYDAIFFGGSVADVPAGITAQLAPNGRLVVVISGSENGILGRATLMAKFDDRLSRRALFEAGTRPLPGFEKAPAFAF